MTETPITETNSETIEVTDLDQFVRHLVAWHTQKIKVLEHMISVPEGTVMERVERNSESPENFSIELTGDMLVGFRAGLELALMELSFLPFIAITDDAVEVKEAVPG